MRRKYVTFVETTKFQWMNHYLFTMALHRQRAGIDEDQDDPSPARSPRPVEATCDERGCVNWFYRLFTVENEDAMWISYFIYWVYLKIIFHGFTCLHYLLFVEFKVCFTFRLYWCSLQFVVDIDRIRVYIMFTCFHHVFVERFAGPTRNFQLWSTYTKSPSFAMCLMLDLKIEKPSKCAQKLVTSLLSLK